MALNLKTLGTRSLSAAVFVVLLVGSVLWNYYSFTVFFFVVAMIGLSEFYKIAEKLNAQPYKITGFLIGSVVYISYLVPDRIPGFSMYTISFLWDLVPIPFIVLAVAMFSKRENPIQNALFTLAGVVYAVLPFACLHHFHVIFPEFQKLVLAIIFLIWSNDTFAYLGGSLFGKHKMIPRISPGKTWEGTIFGVVVTIGVSFLVGRYFIKLPTELCVLLGVSVPVLATIGDLVESMLKRQAGIKDSGNIMPGHGGILDRFDSLIFVSPVVFVILKLCVVHGLYNLTE